MSDEVIGAARAAARGYRVDGPPESGPADGDRGLDWHIRRNRGQLRQVGDGSVVVKATRVDGLRIQDNFNTRSPISPGVDVGTSTAVTIAPTENTQFPVEEA